MGDTSVTEFSSLKLGESLTEISAIQHDLLILCGVPTCIFGEVSITIEYDICLFLFTAEQNHMHSLHMNANSKQKLTDV
jgi:hypothetical protein